MSHIQIERFHTQYPKRCPEAHRACWTRLAEEITLLWFFSFEFMSRKKIMWRAALSHSRSAPVKPVRVFDCHVASDDHQFEILRLTHTQNLALWSHRGAPSRVGQTACKFLLGTSAFTTLLTTRVLLTLPESPSLFPYIYASIHICIFTSCTAN